MGFDLHGEDPKINKGFDEYPVYGKYNFMPWGDKEKDFKENPELQELYFKEMDQYEEDNPGVYFRNNVWWWRPLWAFVCEVCDDILDDSDIEAGGWNDGKIISEDKATRIAGRLDALIEDGTVKQYEVSYEASRLEAEQNNKGKKMKDEGYSWSASYPFSEENVKEFATFCSESGGFSIC